MIPVTVLVKRSFDAATYDVDCSALLAAGEIITGQPIMLAEPAGLSLGAPAVNNAAVTYPDGHIAPAATVVQAQISGGSDRVQYTVRARIATSRGNQLEATFSLRVDDRAEA